MFNYRITRINPWSVFKYVIVISLIFGGILGFIIGLVSSEVVGIWGGLFLGFAFGLVHGIGALVYTFLFNLLASSQGGVEIHLNRKDVFLDNLSQPVPLHDQPAFSEIASQLEAPGSAESDK